MIGSPWPDSRPGPSGFGIRLRPLPLLLAPLLAVLLLSAAVLPFLRLWHRSRVALLEAEAGARMDQGITALQSVFLEVDGDARLMAQLPQVREAARQPTPAALDRVPPIFEAFLESYDRYLAIELLDGSGRMLTAVERGFWSYGLRGGEHLRDHPLLLRTALAEAPEAVTISDLRWYRQTPPGIPPLPILHVLLTLPRDWSGRLLRADVRMDGLLRDLRTQVSQPRAEQEVVVLDARGRRLDQGGGSGSVPPWSLPVGSAQRAETPQGLVLWRSFDPLGRARGSRERWIVALRIPPRRLQQLGLLHQPAGLALVLTLYAGTAVTATLLALGRRQRQRQQAQFAQVLDSLLDPHMLLRPVHDGRGRILDFRIAHCNQAADRYNEAESAPVTRRTLLEWLPDHQTSGLLDAYANAMASGAVVVFDDFPLRHPVHGERRYDIRAVRVHDLLCVSWRDGTERHQLVERLAESEKQFRLLAENASDVVLRVSGNGLVLWASPTLTAMLGWQPQEWIGQPVEELLLPSHPLQASPADTAAAPVRIQRGRVADTGGQLHWVEIHSSAVQGEHRQPDGWVMSFRTIDAEVALEQDLEHRARYDPLTGLLNRAELLQRLQALASGRRRRGDGRLMLLFCDLDRFKEVNDRHGHQAGDTVLRAVAERVRAVVRSGDLAGRMGGDELLVVLVGIQEAGDALAVAEKLRRSLAEPIPWESGALQVSVSIGLTEMALDESVDVALHRADQGMYQAKRSGRDGVVTL